MSSGYYSNPRSDRSTQDGPRVNIGNDSANVQILTHPNKPRFGNSNPSYGAQPVTKGKFVYPKQGESVFYYRDSEGSQRQLKHKDQTNDLVRVGVNELVGTTTGNVDPKTGFIEVDWVNSFLHKRWLFKDEEISHPMRNWVDGSKITVREDYVAPGDSNGPVPDPMVDLSNSGSGIDSTTLGYAAVAGALIFTMTKKKKRKR